MFSEPQIQVLDPINERPIILSGTREEMFAYAVVLLDTGWYSINHWTAPRELKMLPNRFHGFPFFAGIIAYWPCK